MIKKQSKKFKKLLPTSLALLCALCFGACNKTKSESNSPESPTEIQYEVDEQGFKILENGYFNDSLGLKENAFIPEIIEGQPIYSRMRMYIGDAQVPIYNVKTNFSQTWNGDTQTRMNNGVTTIGLNGEIEIKIQTSFRINNKLTIRPLSSNINASIDENRNVVTFKINKTGQYTVEFSSDRTLHLFVNSFDDMKITPQTNWIVFKNGVHTHQNDSRINSNNVVELQSNSVVYIAPNAAVNAKFLANNKTNIKIFGGGYIDGQNFIRNANTGQATVPIEFNHCSNITLKTFSIIDPAAWVFNIFYCSDSLIDNCKVISSRSNGDGISLQSCRKIVVQNCFIRSWDDSLVVKNYKDWSNGAMGYTDTVHFKNCLLWTDLAQSMEIGFETVGEHMENIFFEDITVLHNYHKPIFSIHNGNQANIKNVQYKNIVVEDARVGRGDGKPVIVELQNVYSTTWSDQYGSYPIGDIDGVSFENIKVLSGISNPKFVISGYEENRSGFEKKVSLVKNVSFKNFEIYGRALTMEDLDISLAENINFI